MSRQVIPRVMLSSLLLWQLVAGVFVHAHDVPQHAVVSADVEIAAEPKASQEEHCVDHMMMTAESAVTSAPMDMAMGMHAQMTPDAGSSSHQQSSDADCCQSVFCKCPGMLALALPVTIPHVAAIADALPEPMAAVSLLHAGVYGLFRPPI